MLELILKCSECRVQYHQSRIVEPEDVGNDMMILLSEAEADGWVIDGENQTAICESCEEKRKLKKKSLPEKVTWDFYLHSSKEGNYDQIYDIENELGFEFPEEAKESLIYALYEICATLEINPRTGEYNILKIREV